MAGELMLVLDRRDSSVRLEGRAVRVDTPEGFERVPLGLLGLVVVHGSPAVSCDVWRALAERNVPAVLLPGRGKGPAAWTGAGLSTSVQVRRRQHRAASEPGTRLKLAREVVRLKLAAQRTLAGRLNADPAAFLVTASVASPERVLSALDQQLAAVNACPSIPALMGVEGAAASAWYTWLAEWVPAHWRFKGRNRRPPRDPLNGLLSLGYTLAMGEARHVIETTGMDPALGFLHGVVPGRDSLMLDVVEPLRPAVDAFSLGLLDDLLSPQDFHYSNQDGCRLNKDARGLFYRAWAGQRLSWPNLMVDGANDQMPSDGDQPPDDQTPASASRRVLHRLRTMLPPLPEEEGDG